MPYSSQHRQKTTSKRRAFAVQWIQQRDSVNLLRVDGPSQPSPLKQHSQQSRGEFTSRTTNFDERAPMTRSMATSISDRSSVDVITKWGAHGYMREPNSTHHVSCIVHQMRIIFVVASNTRIHCSQPYLELCRGRGRKTQTPPPSAHLHALRRSNELDTR